MDGMDPSVETAKNSDSCGWLLKTVQQHGLSEKLFGAGEADMSSTGEQLMKE
jgi:hypothetical protein